MVLCRFEIIGPWTWVFYPYHYITDVLVGRRHSSFSLSYTKLETLPTKAYAGKGKINSSKKLIPVKIESWTTCGLLWCLSICAKLTFACQSESLRTLWSHVLFDSINGPCPKSEVVHETKFTLEFSYPIYVCLVYLDKHRNRLQEILGSISTGGNRLLLNLFCSSPCKLCIIQGNLNWDIFIIFSHAWLHGS